MKFLMVKVKKISLSTWKNKKYCKKIFDEILQKVLILVSFLESCFKKISVDEFKLEIMMKNKKFRLIKSLIKSL